MTEKMELLSLDRVTPLAVAWLISHPENRTTPIMDQIKNLAREHLDEGWGPGAELRWEDNRVVAWLNDDVNREWNNAHVDIYLEQKTNQQRGV